MSKPKIYVASRASVPERSAMWRGYRRLGANIVSTWIDEAGEGQTKDMSELWFRIQQEIQGCDRLVLYVEHGDLPIKGALVEVGMALAYNKPVVVITKDLDLDKYGDRPLGSWTEHPSVIFGTDVHTALFCEMIW